MLTRALMVAAVSLTAVPAIPPSTPAAEVTAGDVYARVDGTSAVLRSSGIERRWSLPAGSAGLATTALVDPATGHSWSVPASNDFTITLDGVEVGSAAFNLVEAKAIPAPPDPRRADAPPGVQLTLRLKTAAAKGGIPKGVEVDRVYTLYDHAAVIAVDTKLVAGATALRVGKYSLDELTSAEPGPAEVHAYNGGSDWRDDFRHVTVEPGSFDDEGELLRAEPSPGSGWFHVSERRGGLMSRAGRDASGRTWVGVDNARDVIDLGPLASSPPDYNRVANPAYPLTPPGRQRNVAPLGSLNLGRAYTGVYHGGAENAAAAFATNFIATAMPDYPRLVGLNSFHPWSHGPGHNDLNMRAQADAGKAIGLESVMLDDIWQGSSSGDWVFDSARYPDDGHGVPQFVDYLHSIDMRLGLWMSPVEFNKSSQTRKDHPNWVCTPTGQVTQFIQDDAGLGVWDVTKPAFQDYLAGVIDRAVTKWGVKEFKFDFQAWVDCGAHDYLDYEDAFVAMVRRFQVAHPDVTFELDETNDQRNWAFESAAIGPSWFDNGHTSGDGHIPGLTYVSKELHDLWVTAPWLPTSSIGFGVYDGYLKEPYTARYLMPMALLSHFTFWTDLTKLSPADAAETAWWIDWYKTHRDGLPRFSYENTTADPADGVSWMALQPWQGDAGYLFVFRQAGGSSQQSISLKGVTPSHSYSLTDVRDGHVLGTYSGSELAAGLNVTLADAYSSQVIQVTPTGDCAPVCLPG
ncbi:MAG: alpha-galactosidase [Chloroflexota bacterium]|nr:alpha-galactosidase [Chloroflexota bacterium]